MHILFFGIQGSGKGTQEQMLVEKFGFTLFETGQELRKVAEQDTPLGREVYRIQQLGELVDDNIVFDVVKEFLKTHTQENILFDSFMRNKNQYTTLIPLIEIDALVFFLDLSKEEAFRRVLGRRMCPITGKIFGSDFKGDVNPENGETLVTRKDDLPEAIEKRISIFENHTLPVIEAIRKSHKNVYDIDASRSRKEIFQEIEKKVHAHL